mgnify:CR=1 FL=1
MRTIHLRHRLLTLATLAALSGAAFAQAPAPTAGKDALKEPQVRALLTEKGYTNIDDLDFEDGQWETDATSANGKRVDVRVNPTTGDILVEKLVSTLSEADIQVERDAQGDFNLQRLLAQAPAGEASGRGESGAGNTSDGACRRCHTFTKNARWFPKGMLFRSLSWTSRKLRSRLLISHGQFLHFMT